MFGYYFKGKLYRNRLGGTMINDFGPVRIRVCDLTQKQFDKILEYIVESAFREGMLYERGGKDIVTMNEAINSAKSNILYGG